MYQRPHFEIIKKRIKEPKKFIQVALGPRQIGKTTLVQQVMENSGLPYFLLLLMELG